MEENSLKDIVDQLNRKLQVMEEARKQQELEVARLKAQLSAASSKLSASKNTSSRPTDDIVEEDIIEPLKEEFVVFEEEIEPDSMFDMLADVKTEVVIEDVNDIDDCDLQDTGKATQALGTREVTSRKCIFCHKEFNDSKTYSDHLDDHLAEVENTKPSLVPHAGKIPSRLAGTREEDQILNKVLQTTMRRNIRYRPILPKETGKLNESLSIFNISFASLVASNKTVALPMMTPNESTQSISDSSNVDINPNTQEIMAFVCFTCNKYYIKEKTYNNHLMKHSLSKDIDSAANKFNNSSNASEEMNYHCFACNIPYPSEQCHDAHNCVRHIQHKVFIPSTTSITDSNSDSINGKKQTLADKMKNTVPASNTLHSSVVNSSTLSNRNGANVLWVFNPLQEEISSEVDFKGVNNVSGNKSRIPFANKPSVETPSRLVGEFGMDSDSSSIEILEPSVSALEPVVSILETELSSEFRKQQWELLNHISKPPFKCNQCGKNFFRRRARFVRHRLTHLGINLFPCKACGKSFVTEGVLKKHHQVVHQNLRPFVCDICGRAFARNDALVVHKNIHTGIKSFLCSECDSKFGSKKCLKAHFVRSHLKVKPFMCSQCGKQYASMRELTLHERSHPEDTECKCECEVCGKTFSKKQYLSCHKLLKHKNSQETRTSNLKEEDKDAVKESLAMSKNTKKLNTKRKYRRKIYEEGQVPKPSREILTPEQRETKSFICAVCGMRFKYLCLLKKHELVHTDDKPFVCTICEKGFSLQVHLKNHIYITHQGKRDWVCATCGKAFTHKWNLQQHELIHEPADENCSICLKSFSNKGSLYSHMRRHKRENN